MHTIKAVSNHSEEQTIELCILVRTHCVSSFNEYQDIGLNIFISLHKYIIQYMKTYMMRMIRTKANSL